MNLALFYEDFLFFAIATAFLVLVGWLWRNAKPYDLPHPLPNWFKVWFLSVQLGGGGLPLLALIWSIWQGNFGMVSILVSYFVMLGLQILSESVSLRWFRSIAFVMVPYFYLPYRIWQLYQGTLLLGANNELIWGFLLFEIGLWTINYALDVAQLPRLLRWDIQEDSN